LPRVAPTPGIVEYVILRLARRFLFTEGVLHRFGRFLPYYRTNVSEVDPAPVVDTYARGLDAAHARLPSAPTILEIGSGATNAVGYALAAHPLAGPEARVVLFEPFAPLDAAADSRARASVPPEVLARVRRVASLADLPAGCIDLVVSYSVLEHVRDPGATFAALRRVLAPGGLMLHAVDYRDHFFKYPYHFLLFSRSAWERWLDPGDLPRWRLKDHVEMLGAAGFSVETVEATTLAPEFEAVRGALHREFDATDASVAVAQALLLARPA
jgi:SAM-dependent methyltransferase